MQAVPPPPPPVIFKGDEAPSFFGQFPFVMDGRVKTYIIGVRAEGERPLLDALKAKLAGEGWTANFQRDRSGNVVLLVGTENKNLDQTVRLARRFEAHEFGNVVAQPIAIPRPSESR
jgi:hypothetical protein